MVLAIKSPVSVSTSAKNAKRLIGFCWLVLVELSKYKLVLARLTATNSKRNCSSTVVFS